MANHATTSSAQQLPLLQRVKSKELVKQHAFVNGQFVEGRQKSSFVVADPGSGVELGKISDFDADDTLAAITVASDAWSSWKQTLAKDRQAMLNRWHDLIHSHAEDLAVIISSESGKPIREGRAEVGYANSFISLYAEEATRVCGTTVPSGKATTRLLTIKQPVGPAALITPWNFPLGMITRKVAPALAAGCTVVVKPSELTPFSVMCSRFHCSPTAGESTLHQTQTQTKNPNQTKNKNPNPNQEPKPKPDQEKEPKPKPRTRALRSTLHAGVHPPLFGITIRAKLTPSAQALALAVLAEQAGIPPGVFNVVTSSRQHAAEVGDVLAGSPLIRKLSFTGSTAVGKLLMARCASTVKKVSLELGGCAPFVVFEDADLDVAAREAISGKFRNSGQTCVCPNRFLVQDTVYDAFVEKFVANAKELKVGHGLDEATTCGPLINKGGLDKVRDHVQEAVDMGATVVTGGNAGEGNFFEPTILTGVTPEMRCYREETFGPVAPVCKFATESDAIALANDSSSGLAAYLFTRDLGRAWRTAEAIEAGLVGVNEGVISTATMPFGGVKESGLGREGSDVGIDEYLELKYVCMGF